jgi:hypothetical protein
MTILQNDIKVYQSQDNTDNDSGGGSRTAVEIVDGDINNLFPDISRIDTVSGDVGMRKVFPTVVTTNRDIYFGAHAMIRKTPTDPNVSALLFHTDDPHDKRAEAQLKLEAYVSASFMEEFYLFGNHIQGSKSVTWLQSTGQTPPVVGEIYMLKEPTLEEQYVRVSSVDTQTITLSFNNNGNFQNYTRRRIICEIEQPLGFAFTGSDFNPAGQEDNTADTFATQISDAAKFYATKTLDVDANTNDSVITVDSIFEQIVPASITQVPLVNQDAVIKGKALVPSGVVTSFSGGNFNINGITTFPTPVVPASITQFFNSSYKDDGKGNLIEILTTNVIGSIDYNEGIAVVFQTLNGVGSTIYEIANSADTSVEFTEGTLITQGNRNLVYVQNISPNPSSGNLYIDYRSNGKWSRIISNGDNTLGVDPQIGAGTISDNGDGTSTISLTLGSLPDIDSTIIYSWGSANRLTKQTTLRTVDSNSVTMSEITGWWIEINLVDSDIDPLTFVMQLYETASTSLVNITSDIDGNLIDATAIPTREIEGVLDFINGVVYITKTQTSLRFPTLNSAGVEDVIIDYDVLTTAVSDPHEIFNITGSKTPIGNEVLITENTGTGTITFNIGEALTDRSSFRMSIPVVSGVSDYWGAGGVTLKDRHIDLLIMSKADGTLYVRYHELNYIYVTGTLALNGDVTLVLGQTTSTEINPAYSGAFGSQPKYITNILTFYSIEDRDLSFQYRVDAPLGGVTRTPATTVTDTAENLFKYKIQTSGGITGEVFFNFLISTSTDETYLLRTKQGVVYNEYVGATGIGTNIGSINYNTGLITLNYFERPSVLFLDFQSMVTDEIDTVEFEVGNFSAPVRNIVFRTSSTRLSNGSFQLRYDTTGGTQIATSDNNGDVTGVNIQAGSNVDSVTGMANINFTVDVLATSLRYDAVAESSLPIDPDLLGLNTVRLPIDGRVPVITEGDHLVIFNEVTTATTNATPLADDVETLARSDQSYIEVIDVNGKRLDPLEYVADKNAGTVTFTNPLNLNDKFGSPLTAPFSVVDRIEDMLLATEVLINGQITLSAPLTHNYTNGISFVASALVWGDTGSRVYNYFAQEIWNNSNPVWSDVLVGDPTTSQYDLINFPIQIDNQSSTSGRWAIIFVNSTTVNVVEEKLGVIQSGISISVDDVAPINPATGLPYFTMNKNGFGGGWITNNVIRINTDSGDNNMWVIRTVKSGALSNNTDNISLEIRGDGN